MPPDVPPWLVQQTTPLWAFILALLTRPATWSRRVERAISNRFGSSPDQQQQSSQNDTS